MSRYIDIPSNDSPAVSHTAPTFPARNGDGAHRAMVHYPSLSRFIYTVPIVRCIVGRLAGPARFTSPAHGVQNTGIQDYRKPRSMEDVAAFDTPCLPGNGMRGVLVFVAFLTLGSISDPGCRAHLQLQGVRSRLAPLTSCVPQVLSSP